MTAQACFECSNKLDSVLFMLSTVLHLVKTDLAKAAADQEVIKTTLDAAEQSVGESGDYAEERKCNIGAIPSDASEIAVAPTDAHKEAIVDEASKATSAVVEQSMEETKCSARKASSRNDYPATGNETEAAATIANMLNSDDCSDLSKKEEFRKKAWAIYNQPSKQKNPFHVPVTREEVLAFDEGRSSKW